MNFKKTQEEQQRLEAERIARLQAPEYEMPSDLKDHAYNIFPALNEINPKSNVEIPFAPEEPSRAPATLEAPEQVNVMDMLDEEPATQEQQELEPAVDVPSQEDYQQAMNQSSERARSARLNAQFSRTADAAIGMGLGAKFTTDQTMYKDLAANADEPVKNLLLANELKNNKAKNDPASQISKLVRKSLSDMGMNMAGLDEVSYAQIDKLYPNVTQALSTKLANESKREDNRLMREVKADNKVDNDSYKAGQSIDRQVAQLRDSDEFKSYEGAKTADALIKAALASKSSMTKVEDAAAFMNYAKSAQGDQSVVKSEDMKVLAGKMGYESMPLMISQLAARKKGSSFSREEMEAMARVLDTIKNSKRERIQARITPLRYKAEKHGYDLKQNFTPEFLDEIYAPMPLSLEQRAAEVRELKAKQGK